MTPDVASAWTALLTVLFGPSNRLDWPSDHTSLVELMRLNEQLLARDPPGPVILPFVDPNGDTTYYAIAGDDDQARHLGEVIGAFIGPTGATFTGRTLRPDPYDQIHGALVRFAGSPMKVFRFDAASSERGRVQRQVRRLLTTWTSRPPRTLGDVVPVGRLLDDFEDALHRGEEERAKHLLYEDLLRQGRLSGPNRIFLESRYLAAFEQWDVLDNLPALDDLLHLRRPALVSDALARLALHRLSDIDDAARLAAFTERVATRFGALVPSLDTVRSIAGAAYHVLWSLHAGEPGAAVAARLNGTPWASDPLVAAALVEAPDRPRAEPTPTREGEPTQDQLEAIEEAVAAGLYDRAIELLEATPVALPLVAVLGRILRETLNLRAGDILRRYRVKLGESAVQEELDRFAAVMGPPVADDAAPTAEMPEVLTWPEVFRRLAAGEWTGRAAQLEQMGFVELIRGDDLGGVVDALDAAGDNTASRVIDEGLTLCRRLEEAECDPDRLAPLRQKLVEVWAILDGSGQWRRAKVLIEQVEKLLRQGVAPETYSEVVGQLMDGWKPFLTDQAVGLSLSTLEVLASFQPAAEKKLAGFASDILTRIGPYNSSRIPRPELLVAGSLASEFGLQLDFGDALSSGPLETEAAPLPSSFVIGLYSLDEAALQRTAALLEREYPGVTVETNSDKVSTDRLKALARRADVFVMAELSSKHAATDAIKAARYPRTYGHAAGKGSSSLLRAVHEQVGERLAELVF